MQQQKNNFLDKNSLFAILFLGLCWLVWDAHMKKKYPQNLRNTGPQEEVKTAAVKAQEIKVAPSSRRFYKYFGSQVDLVFSSDGFGVSQFK